MPLQSHKEKSELRQQQASRSLRNSVYIHHHTHNPQAPVMHTEPGALTYQAAINMPGASQCDLFHM